MRLFGIAGVYSKECPNVNAEAANRRLGVLAVFAVEHRSLASECHRVRGERSPQLGVRVGRVKAEPRNRGAL
jgi:hypothetical protein